MVVEQTVVDADVFGVSGLPFQRTVFKGAGDASRPGVVAVALHVSLVFVVVCADQGEEVVVSEGVLVAEAAPAGTKLEVADWRVLREEGFIGEAPSECDGGECAPTVFRTELA